MARRAKSAEEKRARGNPGKRAIKPGPDLDVESAPKGAPGWLTDKEAVKIWNVVYPDLSQRLIKSTDSYAVARWCYYMSLWLKVKARLGRKNNTLTYETDTKHGKMRRIDPDFQAMGRLESDIVKLEEQIGLTPRARLSIVQAMANGGRLPVGDQPPLPLGGVPGSPGETGDDAGDEPRMPFEEGPPAIGALSRPH